MQTKTRTNSNKSAATAKKGRSKSTSDAAKQTHPKELHIDSNESDSAPCIQCKNTQEESQEEMIQCERCSGWVCRTCSKLSKEEYDVMSECTQIHWFCSGCDLPAMTAIQQDLEIEEKCKKFYEELHVQVSKLEEDIQENKTSICELKDHLHQIESSITKIAEEVSATNKNVHLAATEHEEKAKRNKNLVIRGIPEMDDTQEEEQLEPIVKEILTGVGITNAVIEKIHRIGKKNQNGRPRPTRVIVNSEEMKWKIVGRATKIRTAASNTFDPKKIYIAPDMTKLEREKQKELLAELKNSREADPNGKYKILKGQVIKIPPGPAPPPAHQGGEGHPPR